ncbi:hypothetical protein B0J17DRAFT_683764 [Rhizoctonia solani]|nr:hypothetical protein B0J17DRAFT_683764 [Rhizoctonia solani]
MMPIKDKPTPGPRAESCLTCRQRKKKCDKSRPFCQQCLDSRGRLVCLGYDNEPEPEPELERPPDKECTNECEKTDSVTILPTLRVGVEFEEAVPGSSTRTAYFGTPISASGINDYLTPSTDLLITSSPYESLFLSGIISAHQQDQGVRWKRNTSGYTSGSVSMLPLPASIPRGVNANKQMRESYIFFILGEYQSRRVKSFFSAPSRLHGLLAALMKRPRMIECWYLGAKIFETFNEKPEKAAIQTCSQWVTRYVNHITNPDEPPSPYPSTQEVKDKLNGLIELEFAQTMVLGTAAGYSSLRLALPSFLRLVSEDSNLWVEQEHSGMLCVSIPAVLTSSIAELVEYDSTGFPIQPEFPVDWVHGVHGVPMEMMVNLAEVHNWRAQRKDVDWTVLEMRALSWRWHQREIQSDESADMVFRAAIQEAWRHTTLIYIYMGVCGVTSHDPRVQASVQQMLNTHLDVHFSMPSIVAGLAAPYESQRTLIIRKMKSFYGVRIWKVRGQDFVRVLEHLWHGPAASGGAVVWDDYVQARCKVLPIR